MPELPYTALPTPAMPIGDLKSWRLILRCTKCNRKVVLALTDIARTHGAALTVWRAIDRLRCDRRLNATLCGGVPRRVVLAECDTYGKTPRITRQVVVRDG
jgi:nucleoside phosphorylase